MFQALFQALFTVSLSAEFVVRVRVVEVVQMVDVVNVKSKKNLSADAR